jgi:hypothetical protein
MTAVITCDTRIDDLATPRGYRASCVCGWERDVKSARIGLDAAYSISLSLVVAHRELRGEV